MKITTHIRNIIFLCKENRKEVISKVDPSTLIGRTQANYKRKNSWVRNQVALLIRKIRKEKPYKIQDYSKAKQFYDNQPEPIDFSKVKEGSYVVKHSDSYIRKGKRWCEYFTIFNNRGVGTFKVGDKYANRYFTLLDYTNTTTLFLEEGDVSMYRFATKEEIEQFKIARKNYKQKKKEINTLQKQITKLYKEL